MTGNSSASAGPLSPEVGATVAGLRARAQAHGGDLAVRAGKDGQFDVEFFGACRSCPALPLTFLGAVETELVRHEQVRQVTCEQVHVSTKAQERLRAVWAHRREGSG